MRTRDWSKTSLGPIETWPQSLLTTLSTCLASRFPTVIYWGPKWVQLYNDAARSLFGEKHPDISFGNPMEQILPEVWDVVETMFKSVRDTGEGTWHENRILPIIRYGFPEECYFTYSYAPIKAESGKVEGIHCAVIETTRQVIGDRRLRTLKELSSRSNDAKTAEEACAFAAQALENNRHDIPFALIYLTDDHAKEARLTATVGDINELPSSSPVIHLGEASQTSWPLAEVHAGNMVEINNLQEKHGNFPGGAWPDPPDRALIVPIASSSKEKPIGMFIIGIGNMTHVNNDYREFIHMLAGQIGASISNARAYEEERRRIEKLIELDQAKTNFFSNVSHEFRTPLTLMLGPLEDTISKSNKSLSEADRDQLTTVYQNTLRLLKLVNTLLDFSRIEAKRAQASYKPTDLSFITSELASSFESAIEKAGLKYEVFCAPLSEPVYVDPEMWEKIVLNLISNALKFTFEGQITVELKETVTHAKLIVQDTGVGIPQEELPNLFKRFHRIKNSRSRSHEGTGIGLALVKELVELHGGTIDVISVAGKGTAFTLNIPKGIGHLDKEGISAEKHEVSTAVRTEAYVNEAVVWDKSDAEAESPMGEKLAGSEGYLQPDKNIRILLVDDNADMLKYVKRLLSAYWNVEAVKDGVEALAAARREKPDLILSDVMMPNMNGFELLAEVRKDSSIKHIPVILLSARAGEEATIEGLEKGADDYLVKPFSARELIARVRTQLEVKHTQQDNTQLREAEEELRKFKIISDYAFDAFILMREDGTFAYLNDLALKRWGYTREEAQYIRVPDVDPIYQEEKFSEAFAQAQKQGALPTFETIHKRKDGSTYPVEVSMGGISLEGKPHMFAVARDITERRLAEATLKARNEELQKTNNDLDNFIYTASHDLKAPITNVEGLMHMLVRNLPAEVLEAPKVDKVIEMIRTSIGRFKSTINDLTELSKLQRSTEDNDSLIYLSEIFEEVRLDLETAIEDSGAKLDVNFSQCSTICFSKKNLRSVIYNLVSNAIKYHSPEREPLVRVFSKMEQDFCVLTVEDNGLGMDLSQESKVFAMFKRLHDHVEGSGVGLYIVKKIVENSGGKITVESEVDKGSTFKVYFNCK
jgi:PAS domain S-box-containing protein